MTDTKTVRMIRELMKEHEAAYPQASYIMENSKVSVVAAMPMV